MVLSVEQAFNSLARGLVGRKAVTTARGMERLLNSATSHVIRHLVTNVTVELVINNPKDTGWSSSKWDPSVGRHSTVPQPRPRDRAVASQLAVTSLLANRGRVLAIMNSYRVEQGSVFIVNNAPYIEGLNNGKSPQQSPGFVQRSITAGIVRTFTL